MDPYYQALWDIAEQCKRVVVVGQTLTELGVTGPALILADATERIVTALEAIARSELSLGPGTE